MRGASAALALLLAVLPAGAAEAPLLDDFWAGDCPGDEGGVLAVRWRTRKDDPAGRFWRVWVKQVALPDGKGRPVPVDGPVNWPKPGGLSTDFQKDQLLLREVKRPFWARLGDDPRRDAHWAEVDLALHFPPKALDEALEANRKAREKAAGTGDLPRLEEERKTLEARRAGELDRIRRGEYRVQLAWQDEGGDKLRPVGPAVTVRAEADFWDARQANHLALTLLLCALVLLGAKAVRLRSAPAGLSPEGDRPAFLLPGGHGLADLSTLSVLSAMRELGRRWGGRLTVLHANGAVLAAARALAPSARHAFLSEDRWAYAAGAAGRIRRERPGTSLPLGWFYAESLLLAETAAEAGARQVGGTDNELQMPFLAASCEETLLGEDLYAAEARLTGRSAAARTLAGQDRARLLLLALLLAGAFGLLHPDLLRVW